MSVEHAIIVLLVVLLFWMGVLLVKEFSTANRKIEAIFNAAEAEHREQEYKNLLWTLNLHIGYHTWTQLTTEQKDLLADVIDEEHRKQDIEDGNVGTSMEYKPTERWWR